MVMNSPGIVIPNALDEELRDNNLDDDFTTHPLERLSSAATCLVAGVEYTHGQQVLTCNYVMLTRWNHKTIKFAPV